MALTHHPILVISMTAAADLTRNRFIGADGDVCAAGALAAGIGEYDVAAGEQASVNAQGLIIVEAGAAVAVGAQVESDANGLAITLDTGIANGLALDAAAASGDLIRILR
ncbi:capsid cement protein [Oceanobacter mangrovi]|uniref:capsid cement protein n=1 Tax=Oceanobacter mangrovi TaxID=2862510 RepID=UPI001C8DEB16|nr:capsid cement protein [Oceanobacter mangrovi]